MNGVVSVGKVNYILKALIEKGLIKADNFYKAKNKRIYKYLLTQKGLEEKITLTKKFIERNKRKSMKSCRGNWRFMKNKITVQDTEIKIVSNDYISLTDMVKNIENGLVLIEKWLRNKNTIEFLGVWEEIYNTNFNSPEFEGIKNEAGLNRFSLSVKMWINKTNAIGIMAKAGRYGGTYAHKDIAFEFASWISPKFKLYLIKEFQRLKDDEIEKQKLGWDIKRTIVKMNYQIHTDAIKNNLIPPDLAKNKISFIYASEADLLNVALFGVNAKQWSEQNPNLKGNMRDYATAEQLIVMANLESLNAQLIKQNVSFQERLIQLNKVAIEQLKLITKHTNKILEKK